MEEVMAVMEAMLVEVVEDMVKEQMVVVTVEVVVVGLLEAVTDLEVVEEVMEMVLVRIILCKPDMEAEALLMVVMQALVFVYYNITCKFNSLTTK